MELIDGPSLAARIAQSPLPEAELREIAVQISSALAYMHAHAVVHRDVKPANILLGTDTASGISQVRARLTDFGIVRLLGTDRLTQANFAVGTASYLAPEQARGGEVGPPADIYAFGLVLLEAMTGVRAYPGPAMQAVIARLERPPEIPPDLAAPWPGLLRAMTSLDSTQRPSAPEVIGALRRDSTMATLALSAADPAGVGDRTGDRTDRTKVFSAAGVAAGVSVPTQPATPVLGPVGGRIAAEPGRNSRRLVVGAILALAVIAALLLLLWYRNGSDGSDGSVTIPKNPTPAHSVPGVVATDTASTPETAPALEPSATDTATVTDTATDTATATDTPTDTDTATPTPTSVAPQNSATSSPSGTATVSPTGTASGSASSRSGASD